MTGDAPLAGLRVLDLSTWIAGAYCTKLLADGGADVVMVEGPGRHPLRRWSASGATIAPGTDGALFNFLAASKRSVAIGDAAGGADDEMHDLLSWADAVVWSRAAGSPPAAGTSPAELLLAHPHLTVTSITPFGLEGPWSDRPATELTLQAWSGGIVGLARGWPDRAPVQVGGQIGEWLTGVVAANGTLASRRRCGEVGELVDVSMLETMATCLTYHPVTFNDQLGRPMRRKRFVPIPGVGAASDGLVGLGCGTGQQWLDFCVMVGHPEWMEDRSLFLERTALAPDIDAWLSGRTVQEILEQASAFRIPNAPIAHGANVTTFDHLVERETFVANPREGAVNPRPPFRFSRTTLSSPRPAPAPGSTSSSAFAPGPECVPSSTRWNWARTHATVSDTSGPGGTGALPPLPFAGVRVLDMTSYWAGPLAGHLLALLGADVIHLESAARPDGARLVGGVPQTEDRYWERGPIFSALNTNKRSLSVDVSDPRGLDSVRRFVATCDVVIENHTPRVMDHLGLDYDSLRQVRSDLIMVRMPGFGLDGPWRDLPAFAFVIEDAAGLTWMTGYPDVAPVEPYCVGDANAGLHALFGLMLALEHRRVTGEGQLVEVAMVDAALNVAAEQVIEQSAYGALLGRDGNRGPLCAPQNVYRAAAPDDDGRDDAWVAIAVENDSQWGALVAALGVPGWAVDPRLERADGRRAAHDLIDENLAEWCRTLTAAEIVERLWGAGVPVGKVVQPQRQAELAQMQARGFFEEVDHPVIGRSRCSTPPMRFSAGPDAFHRRHAPLLGEHNAELLAEVGMSAVEIEVLEAAGVIAGSIRA